jgi:hypothetical protein
MHTGIYHFNDFCYPAVHYEISKTDFLLKKTFPTWQSQLPRLQVPLLGKQSLRTAAADSQNAHQQPTQNK